MKVFILEDDPERMLWLRERLFGHDVTHAESCAHLDRFDGPYDVVLFDHDLGGRQMDEHEDNGAHFAARVADRIGDATVIIHSYNPCGARHIKRITGGICAPFRGALFIGLLSAALGE